MPSWEPSEFFHYFGGHWHRPPGPQLVAHFSSGLPLRITQQPFSFGRKQIYQCDVVA
jgi:hypothetical protein